LSFEKIGADCLPVRKSRGPIFKSVPTRPPSGLFASQNAKVAFAGREKKEIALRRGRPPPFSGAAAFIAPHVVFLAPTVTMPVVITDEPWVPAQETFITGPEMRGFAAGRPSRKRAREVEEHGLEDDEMVDEHEVERLRKASRPTYKQVVGKASGRAWKQPAKQRAASFMKPQTGGTKSWDDRMKEKAAKKAFQEAMKEKAEEARAGRKAEHQRRAAKKQQKEENRKRTGIIMAEVTNPKTIAKHAKMRKETKKQKALKM
jgi:rRNA-processing protein CGR1